MTPQELKNSILQLAIQGKLVEQRAEEGTAEELFVKIQEEKQRLIAEKKIKKEKPLPEITEEEKPFDIPESWKWCRLGTLCNIINGFTPSRSNPDFWNGDIPWFTIDDVREQGRFISYTNQHITNKAISKNTQRIVPPDTVLLCCTASVGEYAYTKIALSTNQQFNALVIRNENLSLVWSMYLYMFVQTLKSKIIAGAGKTTFNFLSVGKLQEFLVPIPPLAEQKRIVAKIEELLPYIDRYEQAWSKLEQFNSRFPEDMKKSLLQYAIQGKLVEQRAEEGTAEELFAKIQEEKQRLIAEKKIKKEKPLPEITDEEKPFDIPESWKWVRLGSIFITSSGTTPARSNPEYYNDGKINWVRTTDLNNGVLSSCEIKISRKAFEDCRLEIIPRDSICIAMYGGSGTIGKNARIDFDTTINQSVCAIHPNNLCDMKYVHYFVQFFRSYWMNFAAGSRKDPNINQVIIKQGCFPLPPLAEQKRIVEKLEQLLPLCDRLK